MADDAKDLLSASIRECLGERDRLGRTRRRLADGIPARVHACHRRSKTPVPVIPFVSFVRFCGLFPQSALRTPHLKCSPICFVSFVSFCGRFPAFRIWTFLHSAFCLLPSAFCLGLLCRSPDLYNLSPRISDRAGLRRRLLTNRFSRPSLHQRKGFWAVRIQHNYCQALSE